MAPPRVPSRKLPMMLSRLPPMTRTVFAAVLLSFGLALTGLGAACDSEPPPVPADKRLDAMIGQMIMVGFLGDNERDAGVKAVRDQLAKGIVGGVVLYPENIGSPNELRSLTAFLRNAKSAMVPFIAVDQEGGKVQRLTPRNGHRYFPSAWSVGRNPAYASADSAERLYATMAEQLAYAGFNLNFGPVVDLNVNPANPVIGQRDRSFSADPNTVTALARAFILAHRNADIVTVAKHFPGHGSSRVDSHKALADVSDSWREIEIEPYRALAKDGMLDAVMLGHLYHPTFSDGAKLPASLSGRAVRALRDKADRLRRRGGERRPGDGRGKPRLFARGAGDQSGQCRHRPAGVLQCPGARHRARPEDPRHHRRRGARRAHLALTHRQGLRQGHGAEAPADGARPRRQG